MNLSQTTQATLLLTSHFNKADGSSVSPLTNTEWGKLALWFMDVGLKPENLLTGNPSSLLAGWSDAKITIERIEQLLNRGSALALAVEKWSRAGLWVLTRSDHNYPRRLKKHLNTNSPPVIYGCGNQSLLNKGGIAVIGSRNTSKQDLDFSSNLGKAAAVNGFSIISGGARGVDEASMLGALNVEGTVIGVLADSLLKASSSHKYRQYLMNNNLVLISTFYPEAGFNVGNAMQRNKYIYCLADAGVAVHSGTKGGTWSGALENIKKKWVPMWVKETTDKKSGNQQLVDKGASWLSSDISKLDFESLFKFSEAAEKPEPTDLLDSCNLKESKSSVPEIGDSESNIETVRDSNQTDELNADNENEEVANKGDENEQVSEAKEVDAENHAQLDLSDELSFYDFFLIKFEKLTDKDAITIDELVTTMGINKTQLNQWLKVAVEQGKIKKNSKPVSYQWVNTQQEELF